MTKKIGFLFNHDAVHQVAHIAPVIARLRTEYAQIEVIAMVSSLAQLECLQEIVGTRADGGLTLKLLETPVYLKRIFWILNTIAPIQRLYILGRYRHLFEHLDCLVVPEMTSTKLKTVLGLKTTPLILLPHGAGDRSVGYCKEIKLFDHVLLAGTKVRDRMLSTGLIGNDNYSIVGYPKFDSVEKVSARSFSYFDNSNPTVLYNPHFDPTLSSWYEMGIEVLEFFSQRKDYNLIFAPHVMLFKKRFHFSLQNGAFKFTRALPQNYLKCSNIRIDLGSNDCVDMHYTVNSDIYLGDVSSQVYEFLHKPRPCIFLNSHNANWVDNPNYQHWHCGPVLKSVSELPAILKDLESVSLKFRKTQARSFAETFDLKPSPSSHRAALSIISFLENQEHSAHEEDIKAVLVS